MQELGAIEGGMESDDLLLAKLRVEAAKRRRVGGGALGFGSGAEIVESGEHRPKLVQLSVCPGSPDRLAPLGNRCVWVGGGESIEQDTRARQTRLELCEPPIGFTQAVPIVNQVLGEGSQRLGRGAREPRKGSVEGIQRGS